MDDHTFEQRFLLHVEPLTPQQAFTTLEAALDALGEAMDVHGAQAVAKELPPRIRQPLLRGKGPQQLALEDVYRHVGRALGLFEGHAAEQAQIVLEALAQVVEPKTVGRFKRELGSPLDTLLTHEPPPAEVPPPAGHERTLAGGRPGGRHPVSEAKPGPQADSVANPNPHGDTKISSSQGTTQEREDETLATGEPGSGQE